MNLKNPMLKRVLAIVLVVALIATMLISVIVSSIPHSHAEGLEDSYTFELTLLEDEQALRVTQRLVFYNDTGDTLDRAMFAIYANMFRRETTVMYETADALPYGYDPGGAEFYSVKVNGQETDWAVIGEGEYFMRVACDIAPGDVCEFEFVYDVLITRNAAFLGVDEGCWRLSGFFPVLCMYNDGVWEGNTPVQHNRYTLTTPASYHAEITLPDMYLLAGTGAENRASNGDSTSTWTLSGADIREFALTIGRAWRVYSGETSGGTVVNVFTADRDGEDALAAAIAAVEICENWFGGFPAAHIDIAETDLAVDKMSFPGLIWLDREVFEQGGDGLIYNIRNGVAEQYFGIEVYSDPAADAWLGVSIPEYATYLMYEELDGYEAFTARMNEYFIDAINVTMPANLVMNADAVLFSQVQFDTVVRHRGAMAMHELRAAMGREMLIDALALWRAEFGQNGMVTEFDFLETLEKATGRNWEKFLTELIFNIDEYSRQQLDWYE
ncbi:MAG: hypothetical protein IJC56_03515 [Clostridia bacterium]|nr:hypothetical protein [Clostridia bacterium]